MKMNTIFPPDETLEKRRYKVIVHLADRVRLHMEGDTVAEAVCRISDKNRARAHKIFIEQWIGDSLLRRQEITRVLKGKTNGHLRLV